MGTLLTRQHFTIITDQRYVAFMLDNRKRTKIKNYKIQECRQIWDRYTYLILCLSYRNSNLSRIHNGMCNPGVTRVLHFVILKNLPYSTEEVKKLFFLQNMC